MNIDPSLTALRGYLVLSGCCILFLSPTQLALPVKGQQACIPPGTTPPDSQECVSPQTMAPHNSWPQNTLVTVAINANQFSPEEFECLKVVFENFNAAATASGNSSGMRFRVTYSGNAVAILNSPYVSGGANLARNAPGISNGMQINRPQEMRPQALGEEYIGTRWCQT